MAVNGELQVAESSNGKARYNPDPDCKFIVVQKFLSVENEFSVWEGLIMNTYFMIKRLGLKDEKAFGLEKSDVVVEYTPFVFKPVQKIELLRRENGADGRLTKAGLFTSP